MEIRPESSACSRSSSSRLGELGCPKVNLQIRRGNEGVVAFYDRLGYVEEEAVSMGKRLESDEP